MFFGLLSSATGFFSGSMLAWGSVEGHIERAQSVRFTVDRSTQASSAHRLLPVRPRLQVFQTLKAEETWECKCAAPLHATLPQSRAQTTPNPAVVSGLWFGLCSLERACFQADTRSLGFWGLNASGIVLGALTIINTIL